MEGSDCSDGPRAFDGADLQHPLLRDPDPVRVGEVLQILPWISNSIGGSTLLMSVASYRSFRYGLSG